MGGRSCPHVDLDGDDLAEGVHLVGEGARRRNGVVEAGHGIPCFEEGADLLFVLGHGGVL